MKERMTRIELALWTIVGILTWFMADVGSTYHVAQRERYHDGWTAIGVCIVSVALFLWLRDRKHS